MFSLSTSILHLQAFEARIGTEDRQTRLACYLARVEKKMLLQYPAVSNACSRNSHLCGVFLDSWGLKRLQVATFNFNPLRTKPSCDRPSTSMSSCCVCIHETRSPRVRRRKPFPQNVDLPAQLPKNKKKPYPIPFKKIKEAARADKKLAEKGIEKPLEPPKNGLLVPSLVPVAYKVLNAWKLLIKGVVELLHVIPVYACSVCPEVHVGQAGHQIQDCNGTGNVHRRSFHTWVKGSVSDILLPIESYHMYDPFGGRIKHETRFNYDRIPALVELCIQAGAEIPEYPSRRRTKPIRMIGRKVIDRGGFVDEPKICHSGDALAELDTYRSHAGGILPLASDVRQIAEDTLEAYEDVRSGVATLMKKYTVKACGYCSEVHVGPWGHNAKLCGAFKHQWRDGKHGWQDATVDEVFPPNYVWHVKDPGGRLLRGSLRRFYGKAPAVVELCVQAGAKIPAKYMPMMRLDIVVPDGEEASLVA